jgi:hypothetical protein
MRTARTMQTRRSARTVLIAAGLAAGLVAGCTSSAERAIEEAAPGTDVDVQQGGDRVIIETEDGSATVDIGGELPERIGDAFAVPSDFVVDATSQITQDGVTLISAAGHLERDDLRALTEELTSAVTAAGWTIEMSYGMGEDVQMIAASRGDDDLQVSMTAVPGTSRFDVVITLVVEGP